MAGIICVAEAVRPIDHPEFFRMPPPPGRSRESTIRLDRDGRFWNEGEPVTHAGMATAFASWITRHPDDGRFILCNGFDWTYFTVDDAPFFVKSLRTDSDRLVLTLSDGSEEPLDEATLGSGDDGALYVRVKAGVFEARFVPAAQLMLEPLIVEGKNSEPELELAGRRHKIGHREPPRAA